jgi:hypothetical protein
MNYIIIILKCDVDVYAYESKDDPVYELGEYMSIRELTLEKFTKRITDPDKYYDDPTFHSYEHAIEAFDEWEDCHILETDDPTQYNRLSLLLL